MDWGPFSGQKDHSTSTSTSSVSDWGIPSVNRR
jgi:hypothetical protein